MKTIELSNDVIVTDPCYTEDIWCLARFTNVLPGTYKCYTEHDDSTDRVAMLRITHLDYIAGKKSRLLYEHAADIGVDSGQAGIFCMTSYRDDSYDIPIPEDSDPDWIIDDGPTEGYPGQYWYSRVSAHTFTNYSWGAYDRGTVSRSGWGDGMYPVIIAKDGDQIVSIQIQFLFDDEEEDEWNEDESVLAHLDLDFERSTT